MEINSTSPTRELCSLTLERDGENLMSKRRQDLVGNLVDIQTDSTIHWWLTFITTGSSAGLRAQQGG